MLRLTMVALLACACAKNPYEKPKGGSEKAAGPPTQMEGVDPEKFDCKAFLPEADVSAIAMVPVRWIEADMPTAPGTPAPCAYQEIVPADQPDAAPVKGIDGGIIAIKSFQVHLDCRPVAIPDATRTLDDLAAAAAPDFKVVELGRRAGDHLNARLIAVDDDTDCVAYVVGGDEVARAALGRTVLAKLNKENMPRKPRPAGK
jgi:hypothetical protein